MSRIGLYELSATSLVGARMMNSPDDRQLSMRAVSMIPAAIVLFPFFLLMSSRNSLINRRPCTGSYAPKMHATNSVTHGLTVSDISGSPEAPTMRKLPKRSSASCASAGKSGWQAISDWPEMIRLSQSGQAVVHSISGY